MSERNVQEILRELEIYRQQLSNSPEESNKFLEESGINGMEEKIKESFSHLCIPQEQD